MKFLDFIPENPQGNLFYFLSAASNERVLNLWKFDKESTKKPKDKTQSHISFRLNDNPIYLDLDKPLDKDQV